MNEGLVSERSRCIEITEPVLASYRLSPDRRLFVGPSFPKTPRNIQFQ